MMLGMWNRLHVFLTRKRYDESGFTTAELLGNAALGIVALAAIWLAMGEIGQGVIDLIKEKLGI
jgi:hypothetical protein